MKNGIVCILLLMANLSLRGQDVTTGLVAHYPFSGNAQDASGNGNDGTVSGATLVAGHDGAANSAYHFNGSTDKIECGNKSILQSENFTVACWVKPDVIPVTNSPTIITKSIKNSDGWTMQVYYGEHILFEGSGSYTHGYLPSSHTLAANVWYFVAMSYDNTTDQVKGYINGVLDTTKVWTIDKAVNRNLTIGNGYDTQGSDGTKGFEGTIDDVRLYNRVLSAAEIQMLYGSNLSAGLVAYYPFNGNAQDASGNGNTGTVSGATLVADRNGNANSAYHFNGTTDKIECGNNPSLQSDDFSVCCWVKADVIPVTNSPTIITKSIKNGDGWTVQVYYQEHILFEGSGASTHGYLPSATTLQANKWYFVTMTYDNAKRQVKGYINGVLDTSKTYTIDKATSRDLTIGNGYDTQGSDGTKGFEGTIDDVRLYNRVLSDIEIRAIYGTDITTGLAVYYPFHGNANDESGNGRDGSAYAVTLAADRFGAPNHTYSFNGSTSHITVANYHPSINRFSFSLWMMKPGFGTSPQTYEVMFSDAGNYQGTRLYFTRDSLVFDIQQGSTSVAPPGRSRVVTIPIGRFNVNEWYHIAGVSDNGVLSIYRNGALAQRRTDFLADDGASAEFGIGYESFMSTGYFSGMLDDIRLYDRPLTEADVSRLYSLVTGIHDSPSISIAREFQLQQNYPNPFNPTTTIQYALPQHSIVTITVYNALGQQVATLINGEAAAGYHSVQFDGSGLASGVYFYRLQAGSFVDTKRLLLVR